MLTTPWVGVDQEAGRAGRDNQPAKCIIYYTYADYIKVSAHSPGSSRSITSNDSHFRARGTQCSLFSSDAVGDASCAR